MISTNFAPNEQWDDAWVSFKLLFQPWRWLKGKEIGEAKIQLLRNFQFSIFNFQSNKKNQIFFFLTGRCALFTILQSLQLPPKSEVIVQAFTCEAVILPIMANNLKPIYCDIETQTFSMNPIELERKITPNTKVAILQYTFGMTPAQRSKILSVINKHKLLLIEDIAHGYSNKKISNIKYQISKNIFLLSFGRSKAISSVFGGAVVTSNSQITESLNNFQAQKNYPSYFFIFRLLLYKPLVMIIKSTYDYGFGKILHKLINWIKILVPEITQKEKRGEYEKILDKAYPNALAILLLNQLKKYEQIQAQRAQATAEYNKIFNFQFSIFNEISNLKFKISNSPLIRFPLLVYNPDEVVNNAVKQNIYLGRWYNQVVAPKFLDLEKVGYKSGSCPVAENVCKHIINLPTNVKKEEIVKLLKTIEFIVV